MNRPRVGGGPRGGSARGGGAQRGGGSSAVLQRANAQLRGQRVVKPEPDNSKEDDIGAYLSSLSRNTKEPQWDKFGESDMDISVSSNDNDKKVSHAVTSKFLKKKTETKENPTDTKVVTKSRVGETAGSQTLTSKSSALNKAAAFVSKFSEKPKKSVVNFSDSDLDMDLSMDSDIVADVRALKQSSPPPQRPVQKPQQKTIPAEKTKQKPAPAKIPRRKTESPSFGDDSISIGIDGSKFTNKEKTRSSYGHFDISDSSASDGIGKGGSKFLKKKPKTKSPSPPPEERDSPDSPKRQSMFRLKSADKYATQVVLDTDEESLADFIGGLSGSTDPGSARTPRTPKSPSSARQAASKFLKPKLSPVGRPSPEPAIDTIREVEEPLDESIQTISEKDSSIDEDSFKIKVLDLDDLEPAVDVEPVKPTKSSSKRSPSKSRTLRSPKEKSRKKEQKHDKKNKKKSQAEGGGSFFASMGLYSVDELLGGGDVEEGVLSAASEVVSEVEEEYRRSPTPLRSILSPTPRSYTPRRVRLSLSEVMEVRSRSPSPDPVSTARAITSRIYTEDFEEDYSGSAASIHSSDDDESVRTLTESGRSSPARSRRSSLSRQKSEDYYSDDFTETSATSRRHTYSSSQSDVSETTSYSEDYTSYVHSSGRSRTPSPRPRAVMRSVRVQTAEVPGLWYRWDKEAAGMAGVTPPVGLQSVDPTPIATHVVNADALESLTAYSPSVLVLNDLLRQQLELTQHFVESQRRLHKAYTGSCVPDHNYTTLQGTKDYIAKNRRPKLTFDEALRQVKEEMGLE